MHNVKLSENLNWAELNLGWTGKYFILTWKHQAKIQKREHYRITSFHVRSTRTGLVVRVSRVRPGWLSYYRIAPSTGRAFIKVHTIFTSRVIMVSEWFRFGQPKLILNIIPSPKSYIQHTYFIYILLIALISVCVKFHGYCEKKKLNYLQVQRASWKYSLLFEV